MSDRIKMKVSEYRKRYFSPDSAPDRRTVISRIRRKEICGVQEGRTWYVYPEEKISKEQRFAHIIGDFDREVVA
jgi:hypothetical protein